MYLRENQEKGYLNTLTVIIQLAKNYVIAFSKILKSFLSLSKTVDLRQWIEWQICLDKKVCVVPLHKEAPFAVYNYCTNHDLNLVLGK